MNFKRSFLFLLVMLLAIKGIAQHYSLIKYKSQNGLSGSTINCIFQDSQGYIWLATQDGGINRFDGKNFLSYTTSDGLPTNDVTAICEDSKGTIWIGTASGVAKFDGLKISSVSGYGFDSSRIYSIYKDTKNNLWFAASPGGWIKYDGKNFRQFTVKDGLPTNDIFCTLEDRQGNYWVGTYHYGVCKINSLSTEKSNLSLRSFGEKEGVGSNNVFCLMEDKKGTIWMGTTNAFVAAYSDNKISRIQISDDLKSDFVSKIVEDDNGAIWIATQEHGLVKNLNGKLSFYSEKEGFPTYEIFSLCKDNESNLWVGTNEHGVCIFKNEAFLNFDENDGLVSKQINSIYETKANDVLIGTALGLSSFSNSKLNSITSISEINNQVIRSICEDNTGKIWLGTDDGIKTIKKNGTQFQFVPNTEIINKTKFDRPVSSIINSYDGSIWVATSGQGLFRFYDDHVLHLSAPKDLPGDQLFSVYEDKKNNLWVGTVNSGLSKISASETVIYTKSNGLADNTIRCIAENEDGILFFGTSEGGLNYLKDGKFFQVARKNGISSNLINSISVDKKNKKIIWLGTSKGMNKLVFDDSYKVISIKIYNDKNGLMSNEIAPNSVFIDSQSNIWIGSSEGLSQFNPSLEHQNNTPPKIVLLSIRLFYQKVDWRELADSVNKRTGIPLSPNLNYKNNHLTFDFQAITSDQGILYSYMLDGFDKNWSPLANLTEATYTNIPAGKEYTFRVKAQNSDGVWSAENIEFKFTIESPIYQRTWFILLVLLLLFVSIFLYINWRTAKLAKEKKLLEDTVEERTLELKETNDQLSDAFKDIKDSINYAQKIQQSILPLDSKVKAALPDSFILFKPRDIVSGDFYWFGSVNVQGALHYIIAAADCTGHGVPGAFMSMVGNTILNEIVVTKHIINPSEILAQLHHGVKTALQQSENESRDGMDICLCSINALTKEVLYAGAFNPLWILRSDGEMEIIKATKSAIGGFTPDDQVFESHRIQMQKGESIYLFTDGYADQFGGDLGKKLTAKKFRDALHSIASKSMKEQGFYLDNYFEIWKGNESQVDDILVIGIRF